MSLKLLVLLVAIVNAEILFEADFENSLSTYFKSSKSGEIVDCPKKSNSKCLLLKEKTNGGDLFSIEILNPTTPNNLDDMVYIEFKYYSRMYANKPKYSSLCVGMTDED